MADLCFMCQLWEQLTQQKEALQGFKLLFDCPLWNLVTSFVAEFPNSQGLPGQVRVGESRKAGDSSKTLQLTQTSSAFTEEKTAMG